MSATGHLTVQLRALEDAINRHVRPGTFPLALTAFGLKPETSTFSCGGMFTETNEIGTKGVAAEPITHL